MIPPFKKVKGTFDPVMIEELVVIEPDDPEFGRIKKSTKFFFSL